MFELQICDIGMADRLIREWATKSIGLIDPVLKPHVKNYPNYLKVYCHDCDEDDCAEDLIRPQRSHMEAILKFSQGFTDIDRVVVHCRAGMSRSPAVAIAILVQHGLMPPEAFEQAKQVRWCMSPNRLILCFADELLNQKGALLRYYDLWIRGSRSLTNQR